MDYKKCKCISLFLGIALLGGWLIRFRSLFLGLGLSFVSWFA